MRTRNLFLHKRFYMSCDFAQEAKKEIVNYKHNPSPKRKYSFIALGAH